MLVHYTKKLIMLDYWFVNGFRSTIAHLSHIVFTITQLIAIMTSARLSLCQLHTIPISPYFWITLPWKYRILQKQYSDIKMVMFSSPRAMTVVMYQYSCNHYLIKPFLIVIVSAVEFRNQKHIEQYTYNVIIVIMRDLPWVCMISQWTFQKSVTVYCDIPYFHSH